jgi:HrpA-like RNA helicase
MISATIQEEMISEYFNKCPILRVVGRVYPVEINYINKCNQCMRDAQKQNYGKKSSMVSTKNIASDFEPRQVIENEDEKAPEAIIRSKNISKVMFDSDLVAELVIRIIQSYSQNIASSLPSASLISESDIQLMKGQAILVFLSGIQAINKVSKALRSRNLASMNAYVLNLHGSMQPHHQRRVFEPAPPGQWKIILSTNIAETSVTVEDVTHVIDCGIFKEVIITTKILFCNN